MSPTFDAFLRSWPTAPWLAALSLAAGAIYLRGWRQLARRDPDRWHAGRPAAFIGGLAAFYLALASPIEPFASLLLQVHMLQHLLLMMVAPPLVWLGWPLMPLVRGLPEPIRVCWIGPLLRWRPLRAVFRILTHPVVAWTVFVATTWLWHTPRGYELALTNDGWHVVEHVCFVAAAMLFWYPVVRPYPSRPRWSRWLVFPYLLLADVQNTLLAAWLTFSPRVLYSYYANVPRLGGISALDDQGTAGVLMWVPGSAVFLLPLFWLGVRYLRCGELNVRARRVRRIEPPAKPGAAGVFAKSYLWQIMNWRYARRVMQLAMAALAAVVVYDGLFGPQVAAMNLAGVLPWIHWRGLLILALLVAGNLFCMACPFTLPRSIARRWLPGGRPWPRALRSKWLAVALVAVFLWSYEAFALWDSPWITAWIVVGYFVAALVVDIVFRGAAFCKYVCPIGQFNFVQSLVSPLEVAVRQPAVCAACTTHECIRGSDASPGCEMRLFQPRKAGNLDCTFCLDCVHACPHENVGVLAVVPGSTLLGDRVRSGVGRMSRRPDLAALVLVLVFGAFANAAGMIEPVVAWHDQVSLRVRDLSPLAVTTASYMLALIVLPVAALTIAAALSRRASGCRESLVATATRYAYALVPLGFAMWFAHYTFHLFTSWGTIVPTAQRFAADGGWAALGAPIWQCACCGPAATWITHFELLALDVGLLASLYIGFRTAEANAAGVVQAIKAFAPWATLVVLLFVFGVWIVFQPMEMRGTLPLAG